MSTGWAWFIASITFLSIVGACWLMIANRRTMSDAEHPAHVWDQDLT